MVDLAHFARIVTTVVYSYSTDCESPFVALIWPCSTVPRNRLQATDPRDISDIQLYSSNVGYDW